ncbi:hypothetical protein B0H14DRAFT_2583667, partial [Mycena olivaceomarginata]
MLRRFTGDLTGIDDLGTERLLKSLWKVSARRALYWWHGSQYYSGSNRRSSRSVYRRIRFRQARPLGGPEEGASPTPTSSGARTRCVPWDPNELSLQCGLQLQRGLQLQHGLQLQREDSQRRSVRDPRRLAPPVQCPLLGTTDESQYLKPRPIFVSNIKVFFSADSDYESFKNCINEVAAQHLEMERYLDHQDEDAKKKVFDKARMVSTAYWHILRIAGLTTALEARDAAAEEEAS